MQHEMTLLWAALLLYVAAGSTAIVGVLLRRLPERAVLGLIVGGLAVHTLSLGLRWARIGHGPFITMFEVLSSNVWSLLLVFLLACWRLPPIRASAAVVMPVMFLVMGWLLTTSPGEGHLPQTYHTGWLYVHVGFGKIFFGAVLVALGMAGVILARASRALGSRFARLPGDAALSELAWRFMSIGFVFETLMLIAGAIWAQDAWGRYWAWDPLETWAFLTWVLLAAALHARVAFRLPPRVGALLVLAVFVVGFLTFFGVPFVSTVPHQGAV
jgi:ABC-type transport system involved in cytochrome c biogenesis permease subunit